MKQGGNYYNQRTSQVIRVAGIIVPLIMVLFGLLVQQGFFPASTLYEPIPAAIILALWTLALAFHFFTRHTDKFMHATVAMFSILAIPYTIYVSGFLTPIAIGWIVLHISSYLWWKRHGFMISFMAMTLCAGLDALAQFDSLQHVMLIGLQYVIITVISGLIIEICRVQNIDVSEIDKFKSGEALQSSRVEAIMNNFSDAVISTDVEGAIMVYNAATLNLLDTNQDLIGAKIDEVIKLHDENGKRIHIIDAKAKRPKPVNRDDVCVHIGTQKVRLELDRSSLRASSYDEKGSQLMGYVVVLRDVTRAKSLEEEKDEFISVVSHELRTPLTIAEGNISNVEVMMERGDIAQSVLASSLHEAHEQIVFLSRMVNDLSTLSRAERGVADAPERINVNEMVHDIYNSYSSRAEHAGLQLNLDLDANLGYVTASRLYLKELLQNFLTNAIKYTKTGSITIIVRNEGEKLEFAVKDSGIGISKADQAKIFDKFYRSEDYRTRETRGTGLGLYVSRKLAAKLGTKIELTSKLNHGSTFSFTLKKD